MFDTVYWVLKWCYHSYTSDKILGCTQYAPISFPLFQLHNFLLPIKQFLRKLWLIRFTKKSCNRFQCSTELQKLFSSVLGWYDSKKTVFLKWCLQLWWWYKYTDIPSRLNPDQIYIRKLCAHIQTNNDWLRRLDIFMVRLKIHFVYMFFIGILSHNYRVI